MKRVWDAVLHLVRSLVGYVLFYYIIKFFEHVEGISPWIYFLGVFIALEVLNLLVTLILRKVFGFDPLFGFKMPLLVYAFYRMVLEFAFLIFLFAVFGFSPLWVILVGLIYVFGVIRHSIRLNRMMLVGQPGER